MVLWSGICATASGSLYCEVSYDHTYYTENTECAGVPRQNIFNGSNLVKDHGAFDITDTNVMPFGPAQCSAFNKANYVSFEDTDLKEVPAGCFDSFKHLEDLDLSRKAIEVIREGAFPNIIKVQHGEDSGQNLSIKSKLKWLTLDDNKIHTIEDKAFMAESLETLCLHSNKIKDISKKFKHLSGKSNHNDKIKRKYVGTRRPAFEWSLLSAKFTTSCYMQFERSLIIHLIF